MNEISYLGLILDDLKKPCSSDDNDTVRMCISAAFGIDDMPPAQFIHGDGRTSSIVEYAGNYSRQQIQQATNYTNTALQPETEYCLAVMTVIQSNIEGVSEVKGKCAIP